MGRFVYILFVCLFTMNAKAIDNSKVKNLSVIIVDAGRELEGRYGHVALRLSQSPNKFDDLRDTVVTFDPGIPDGHHGGFELFVHAVGVGIHALYPSVVREMPYRTFREQYIPFGRGLTSYPVTLRPDEKTKTIAFLNHELALGHGTRPFQIVYYNCSIMTVEALNAGLEQKIPRTNLVTFPLRLADVLRAHRVVGSGRYDAGF